MSKRPSNKDRAKKAPNSNIRLIFLGIVAVVVAGIWLFGHYVYNNPDNVFYGMISNSLSTPGYITQINKVSSSQKSNEYVIVQTGAKNIAEATDQVSLTSIKGYKVVSESIGTPVYDYVRYLSIQSPTKGKNGKPLDYNSVLGLWGVNPADPQVTDGQLFNETALGIVPIGLVSQAQHDQLMKYIRQHHVYSLANPVKRQIKHGRLQYVYNVTINASTYVGMIKQFGIDLGLNQLGSLSNSSVGTSLPLLQITVDTLSRQLVSINSPGSTTHETYSSYGINVPISAPSHTIPVSSLESKLEAVD